MNGFLGCLVSAVLLQILEYFLGLRGRDVGSDAHVGHNRLPLGRGEFGRIPFRMTPIAVDLIQLGARQLLRHFLGFDSHNFSGWHIGIARDNIGDGRRENYQSKQGQEDS